MTECPVCGCRLLPDTPSRSECGVSLSDEASLITLPMPEEELPPCQASPWSRIAEGYEEGELPATAKTLRIVVAGSSRQARFPLPIGEISLGRRDVSYSVSPDLDLAPDGGFAEGVSRQHAKILQVGNRLLVEDLGSANGTFLNDERIKPYLLYPLREGDALQLGTLRLLVEFDL